MNKFLLGLTAVFAMTVAVPAFAADKPEKKAKHEKKPKADKAADQKDAKKDAKKDDAK